MKRIITKLTIIIILTLFFTCLLAYGADTIKLYVNGEQIASDCNPVVINNRTMVPVRSIFEKLGADVSWIGSRQQAVVQSGSTRIILTVGDKKAFVNEKTYELDSPAVVIDGRTLIPARFVSEILGYSVNWDSGTNSVHIDTSVSSSDKSQIQSVTLSSSKGNSTVVVNVKNMVTPKISYELNPTRFVADFPNTEIVGNDSKIAGGSGGVTEVRYAQHSNYSRIVIETSPDAKFEIKYTPGSMIVNINSPSASEPEINIEEILARFSHEYEMPQYTINGNPTVVIDPGHGGNDGGALSYDASGRVILREADANLAIALSVQRYLSAQGVNVVMTRTGDVSLGATQMDDLLKRSEIANSINADLFVSIHNNSFTNPSATGTEILYVSGGVANAYGITGELLANNILSPLVNTTGLSNRGLKDSPKIVVLRETKMPAVLVECAFVSNPKDRVLLMYDNPLNHIGAAIAQGILKTLSQIK